MYLSDQGVKNLALGIVTYAVREYSNLKKKGVDDDNRSVKKLEEFFRSDWCAFLLTASEVSICADDIFKGVKKQVEESKNKKQVKISQ